MPMIPASQSFGMGATVVAQSIYEQSLTQKHRLGERLALGDRIFRYTKAGAALVAGYGVQTAATGGAVTTLQNTCAVTVAAAIGDMKIFVSALTTEQPANTFAEGYAAIWDATTAGMSYLYRVKDHPVIAVGGVVSYINIYDPVHIALTTSDQCNLIANPYLNVIAQPTARTGMPLPVRQSWNGITAGHRRRWLLQHRPL